MTDAFWTAFWVGFPITLASAANAYVVIRQTNKKTEQKAAEINATTEQQAKSTNDKVDTVADRVNGNVSRLNDQLDTATGKIDEMHQRIVVTATHTDPTTQAAIERDIRTQAKP